MPSKPSAGSAFSTALPWGSRMPSLGRISTRAFTGANLATGSERLAGDALVGLDVFGPRLLDHIGRQLRRRRLFIPALGARPVADELLVEGGGRGARLVARRRPEARGVRGQHLVGEDDLGTGAAAELELGVGEDDPALGCVLGAALVDLDRDP